MVDEHIHGPPLESFLSEHLFKLLLGVEIHMVFLILRALMSIERHSLLQVPIIFAEKET